FTINMDTVYQYIIEPALSACYALLLVAIARSPNNELKSAYYTFFLAVGIAGIANIVALLPFKASMQYKILSKRWEYPVLLFEYGSHIFGTTHTFAKFATIFTRVIAI
ncbi:hypothetical protein PFISCL1PPCAC_5022, partial [Pristionchus fissidentatus]